MANYYCEYGGYRATSLSSLTAAPCVRYPLGANKGKHSLFEG